MTATADEQPLSAAGACAAQLAPTLNFLSLHLTDKCTENCDHCCAGSGPTGTHGTMKLPDWLGVLDQARALNTGMVQLIGGEPTIRPGFPTILEHCIRLEFATEVYSNLFHVRPELWPLLAAPGVCMATSYYASDAAVHDRRTKRKGSHARTRANIVKALELGVTLRVSVIETTGGDQEAAVAEMKSLGVELVTPDRVRAIGRAAGEAPPDEAELCGNCGRGRASVLPDGSVNPCYMSNWIIVGNVLTTPLADILAGAEMAEARKRLTFENLNDVCTPGLHYAMCSPFKHGLPPPPPSPSIWEGPAWKTIQRNTSSASSTRSASDSD